MTSRNDRRLHWGLLIGLLIVSAVFYSALIDGQPSGWDALGYRVAGHNIAVGIGPVIEHPFNAQYGPYFTLSAFAVQSLTAPARLYFNYPPGFPVLLAFPQWLGLPDTVTLVVVSLLSLVFTYWLGVLFFDRWVALLAAVIVACMPVHIEWGTSIWSDLPGTMFMLGAITFYVTGTRHTQRAAQLAWGGLAGAMVMMAIFIKYANVLVVLPLAAYALFTQRRAIWKTPLNWSCGGVILLGLLSVGAYNQAVYGHPLETFYSPSRSGISFPFFSLAYALGASPVGGRSFLVALQILWDNLNWLLLLGLLGIVKAPIRIVILLGGLFLTFLFLASIFAWAPQGGDTRYLLPLFTPIALFTAWGTESLVKRFQTRAWLKVALLSAIGISLILGVVNTVPRLTARNDSDGAITKAAVEWVADSEPNAVFMAYSLNDLVNTFGQRTTLFYRRMKLSQPDFELELTRVVEKLLAERLPVYYIEDTPPALAISKEILQRHYNLQLWKSVPYPIFRVTPKAS